MNRAVLAQRGGDGFFVGEIVVQRSNRRITAIGDRLHRCGFISDRSK